VWALAGAVAYLVANVLGLGKEAMAQGNVRTGGGCRHLCSVGRPEGEVSRPEERSAGPSPALENGPRLATMLVITMRLSRLADKTSKRQITEKKAVAVSAASGANKKVGPILFAVCHYVIANTCRKNVRAFICHYVHDNTWVMISCHYVEET
jgi:hypothetical protein